MSQAERVTNFVQQFCTLTHSHRGKPFILADFQNEIIDTIFAEDEQVRCKARTTLIGLRVFRCYTP